MTLLHSGPHVNQTLRQVVQVVQSCKLRIMLDLIRNIKSPSDWKGAILNVSQGKVAAHLECGGNFIDHFVTELPLKVPRIGRISKVMDRSKVTDFWVTGYRL